MPAVLTGASRRCRRALCSNLIRFPLARNGIPRRHFSTEQGSFAHMLSKAQRLRTVPQAFWRSKATDLDGAIPGTPLCRDPYAQTLSEQLLEAPELQVLLDDANDAQRSEELATQEGVRCAFMDRFIIDSLSQRMRQVVLLGSGLDCRIFRLELPPQMRFIEVDEGEVHEAKCAALAGTSARSRCLVKRQAVSLSGNLGMDEIVRTITAAFNPRQPALFLLDGALSSWPTAAQLAAVEAAAALSIQGSTVVGPAPDEVEQQEAVASALNQAGYEQVKIINHHQLSKIYRRPLPESLKMLVAMRSGNRAAAQGGRNSCSSSSSKSSSGSNTSRARELTF